ncbi:MAG: phosphatidylglycerophosphatase A [Holosporales bacterium]|nr:phosphatidylglycerophosphatase A [Holosporales bacterium]
MALPPYHKKLLLFVITFLYTGLLSKKIPGTVGSFGAMLFLFFLPPSLELVFGMAIFFFFLGTFCCNLYITKYRYESSRDPRYIVIDEVCGVFLGAGIIYGFNMNSAWAIFINFLLFRVIDISKPFPIKFIEKSMKNRDRTVGLGIMLDDVLAAIFAAFLQLALYFIIVQVQTGVR